MFGGRIEMPLEEFNAMKNKIDEYEKIINNISKETSACKEENEKLKEILSEVFSMNAIDRLTDWNKVKSKLEPLLKTK